MTELMHTLEGIESLANASNSAVEEDNVQPTEVDQGHNYARDPTCCCQKHQTTSGR